MNKVEELNKIAAENNIALVYIFGSQAHTGLEILHGAKCKVTDPLTDIDVGVVFANELPGPRKRIDIYSEISNRLQDLFIPYPVDLVFLQETHSVFQGNAICGHCVYFSSTEFKESYEENVLRKAADYRPFLERYLDEILEGAI